MKMTTNRRLGLQAAGVLIGQTALWFGAWFWHFGADWAMWPVGVTCLEMTFASVVLTVLAWLTDDNGKLH